MDTPILTMTPNRARLPLVRGEFAPVYWEPLGRRGERLVVGVLVAADGMPALAEVTLQHQRLLEFISERQAASAVGLIDFAFDFFRKTLDAGGIIQDLKAPFASMSIGRIEPISARTEQELRQRAIHLCTLIGEMTAPLHKLDRDSTASKTAGFLKNVRQSIRHVDAELAKLAMKTTQLYGVGNAGFRVHFNYQDAYAQFCSLPLPNARVETATECNARLAELAMIQRENASARVALCINTQALRLANGYTGKTNATVKVQQRAMSFARALGIEAHEYDEPVEAARYLRALSGRD